MKKLCNVISAFFGVKNELFDRVLVPTVICSADTKSLNLQKHNELDSINFNGLKIVCRLLRTGRIKSVASNRKTVRRKR